MSAGERTTVRRRREILATGFMVAVGSIFLFGGTLGAVVIDEQRPRTVAERIEPAVMSAEPGAEPVRSIPSTRVWFILSLAGIMILSAGLVSVCHRTLQESPEPPAPSAT